MGLLKEPEGVDFVVASEALGREEALEMAEWLNRYRREHDQARARREAQRILRRVSPAPAARSSNSR